MAVNAQGVRLSSKPVDELYLEGGSPEHTQDLIAAQDRARSQDLGATVKKWAPWVLAVAVVGGGAYWYLRK